MPYLNFIEDKILEEIVATILLKGAAALEINDKKFHKNIIDPFTLLFEMASFNMSQEEWKLNEKRRQAQKALSNHIGNFHQDFLGNLAGWQNLQTGKILDLVNEERKICAEVKNKHNTLNAGGLIKLYENLEKEVMNKNTRYKDYTAYYIEIIPKSPARYNLPFTPSDAATGHKKPNNPRIRCIDGASFYALATGEETALAQLFDALPNVIHALKPQTSLEELTKAKAFFTKAFQ